MPPGSPQPRISLEQVASTNAAIRAVAAIEPGLSLADWSNMLHLGWSRGGSSSVMNDDYHPGVAFDTGAGNVYLHALAALNEPPRRA